MLKTQELENARQATVISRLEEARISNNRKCEPEVLEAGKYTYPEIVPLSALIACNARN